MLELFAFSFILYTIFYEASNLSYKMMTLMKIFGWLTITTRTSVTTHVTEKSHK